MKMSLWSTIDRLSHKRAPASKNLAAITEDTGGAKLYESAKTRGATQRLIKDMKKNIDDDQAKNTR